MSAIELAKSDQVVEGAVFVSTAAGRSIALTRVSGALQAFENKCPHWGLPLAKGKVENNTITCPWHGAQYDLCSGKSVKWVNSFVGIPLPTWTHCLISMGKKPSGLKTLPVQERDGAIYLND